ncbi:MAG: pyruvate kinase [Planctomycetota bacterium]|jgi:pyruvate kinase|nr:pyruvate kinase [Planctomycetota bacterium]
MRRTKIVCTLGPASNSADTIRAMLNAGMNVARLNFSHGTHESHAATIATFRQVRDELGVPAAVALDTKGPEIRIRNFIDGKVELATGAAFTLTTDEIDGTAERVAVSWKELPGQVKPGSRLLFDDGKITMTVDQCTATEVRCTVQNGGVLSNHKSINIPGSHLEMPYLSEQDQSDLRFGIEQDVDFVFASFTRRPEDVQAIRKFLDYHGGHDIRIIAKIENIEGIENFHKILASADGIMVARGDMGVEVDFEMLPGIQKKFIRACYRAGKIVITATQMLESMVNNPSPTRAEISDVANAVFDGTSAVMLSGESANGKYPVPAVAAMAKIAERAEHDCFALFPRRELRYDMDAADLTNAVCDAACTTARDIKAKALLAITHGGRTARRMAKFRPEEPIVGSTPKLKTFHQLSLSWGVYPVLALYQDTADKLFLHAIDCAKQIDMVKDGDTVVAVASIPVRAVANTVQIHVVGQRKE